jgi:hypothetical protein
MLQIGQKQKDSMTDEDLLNIDVNDKYVHNVDVGEYGLNLFVVAPARMHLDYSAQALLHEYMTFADSELAHSEARRKSSHKKEDYCVYKLGTVSLFRYKA